MTTTTTNEKGTKKGKKQTNGEGGGILANKVQPSFEALAAFVAESGLAGTGTPAEVVAEVRSEMERRIAAGDTPCECTVCGEKQPDNLTVCPFCGDEGIDATTAGAEVVVHKAEPVVIAEAWTQDRLKEATSEIIGAMHAGSEKWWEVGAKLLEIHNSEAWKAGEHKSFRAFCKSEVGISHEFAYGVMAAAKKFTRADFALIGTTKLVALLKAPEEDQAKLLDRAKAGASTREVVAGAKEAKAAKKREAAPPAEKAKPAAEPPPSARDASSDARGRPRKDEQTITLLAKVGGKPQKFPFRTKSTPVLKGWKEGCYCEVPLSETVSAFVELTFNKEGENDGIKVTYIHAVSGRKK